MRWQLNNMPALSVGLLFFAAVGGPSVAHGEDNSCMRGDFVAVVGEAATALRNLNDTNKSKFQDRLRDLKTKNDWSREQYLKAAEPYVRDETIAMFDENSAKLLAEISDLGQVGSESANPDCSVLTQLRARMDVLVKTQNDKWVYMFEKIDKALTE